MYIVESLEQSLLFTKGSHPVSNYKEVLEVINERPVTILHIIEPSLTFQYCILYNQTKFQQHIQVVRFKRPSFYRLFWQCYQCYLTILNWKKKILPNAYVVKHILKYNHQKTVRGIFQHFKLKNTALVFCGLNCINHFFYHS